MNEIDLTKIAVKELGTKTIKANFDGTEKDFTIVELSDGDKADLRDILTDAKDAFRTRKAYILLLSSGIGIDTVKAEILYDNVTNESIRVGNLILEFTKSIAEAKAGEAVKAEKNSQAETANNP